VSTLDSHSWKTRFWSITGWFFAFLAFIGALLPAIPTTPFLLLALYAFSRSDKRMVRRILRNKTYGSYLRDYLRGRGIPLSAKIAMFTVLAASISLTLWLTARSGVSQGLLIFTTLSAICVFVGVNWLVLREPTRRAPKKPNS
jgi:uncharacterized membrane protein YbaN (DUF454 family)